MKERQILGIFPGPIRNYFVNIAKKIDDFQEIRLCVDAPVRIISADKEFFLNRDGSVCEIISSCCWYVSVAEMEQILDHICSYSRYAYEDTIGQGFLTVPGGHRIGVSGEVILGPDGQVKNMKYIRYMNIRIAHEIMGVSDVLLPLIHEKGYLCNTLLVAPPGCGKTTMLRDLIRQVSNGSKWAKGKQVGVVDERSEIAGCFMGVAGNHLGIRTDVLDGCPKVHGMMMLLRSMSPQVIAVDEIGSSDDKQAILSIMQCGCKVLATMHASSMEEVRRRGIGADMFERFVFMGKSEGNCVILSVCKGKGEYIYG